METALGTSAQFIEERKYLKNVTPKTLSWYEQSFQHFEGCQTESDHKSRIIQLRQRGISPTSINSWLRCINAYTKWANLGFTLPKLQEDKKILATLSSAQVASLLGAKRPGLNHQRIQTLAAVLLDTGLRVAEALALHWTHVDLESLLLHVMGKGRKERRVPISLAGRKWLYVWKRGNQTDSQFVFTTSTGTALSIRNAQRDLTQLSRSIGLRGVRCSPHTLRHTFAVAYLRSGGNLEYLRRILGHSSIQITQRYLASLTPEDLGRVHNSLSPLAQL